MMKDDFVVYLSKKVRLTLSNNYNFTGVVLEVSDDYLTIRDKFGGIVTVKLADIFFIIEVRQ